MTLNEAAAIHRETRVDMTDACYRIAVEQRIKELWAYRAWYRANRWAAWSDIRREHDAELRALVRIARAARKGAAAAARDYDAQVDTLRYHNEEHEEVVRDCGYCQKDMADSSRLAVGTAQLDWRDSR